AAASGDVTLGLSPHDLHLKTEAPARCTNVVTGLADVVEHTGTEIFTEVMTEQDIRLMARMHRSAPVDAGQRIEVALDPHDLHVFSAQTGEALLDRSGASVVAGRPRAVE